MKRGFKAAVQTGNKNIEEKKMRFENEYRFSIKQDVGLCPNGLQKKR